MTLIILSIRQLLEPKWDCQWHMMLQHTALRRVPLYLIILVLTIAVSESGTAAGAHAVQQTQGLSHKNINKAGPGALDPAVPPFHVSCTAFPFSKQSCILNNVCFQRPNATTANSQRSRLTVFLQGTNQAEHLELLQQHLDQTLASEYALPINCSGLLGSSNSIGKFLVEHAPTLLWQPHVQNQDSFGHALVNELFTMFLVLQDHFGDATAIPRNLQLLISPSWVPMLQRLTTNMITHKARLFSTKLESLKPGTSGVCFRHLIIGDGGYLKASKDGMDYSGQPSIIEQYMSAPSIFNSKNWWAFRRYAFEVAGVIDYQTYSASNNRPLILLNDKRYGPDSATDRRVITDIDALASSIKTAYPSAEVLAARFRDMSIPDQLRLTARTNVFITTQGSSAFLLVFLPRGATCIVLACSEEEGQKLWKPFFEIDRFFPVSYINFVRYNISANSTDECIIRRNASNWKPRRSAAARRAWQLFNADVRVNMARLRPYLERALPP